MIEITKLAGKIGGRNAARSALVAALMTVLGIGLQVSTALVMGFDTEPPELSRILGVTACYLLAGFAFALGFFALRDRLPGRSPIGAGLRYAATVVLAVWISGSINFCSIDFAGGWDPLSRAKLNNYWMDLVDAVNFLAGGFILGLFSRKVGASAPAQGLGRGPASEPTGGLVPRIAIGAAILPLLCFAFYSLASLVLPEGIDLSGQRRGIYDAYLFIPLAVSGAGAAFLHDILRRGRRGGVAAEAASAAAFIFVVYWIPNCLFILLFGFTWQILVDFLLAMAISLFLGTAALEAVAKRSDRDEAPPRPVGSSPARASAGA